MGSLLLTLGAELADGFLFSSVPVTRIALDIGTYIYDKKRGPTREVQQASFDENTLEGRINRAMSVGNFAGAEELVRHSDLPSYTRDRVLNQIEEAKQKVIEYLKEQQERNDRIRRYMRDGDYDGAIKFVKGLDVPKDDRNRIVAALKDDRKHRPSRQAFAEAVRYCHYDEARRALAAIALWSAQKKEIYGALIQELERIANKEMTDRDYGRAIAQVGQLDMTRAQRRERIHQLEAARRQLPDKERLVDSLRGGDFDYVRRLADSLDEWPDGFKAAFRILIDDIESVTPKRW
ncbi:MAG: hypothetical protein ICV60_06840 [Pyrinomonadaceae bacterium]|nr:hypothetical protein [Pyrinomonadaceae bacterium]